MKITVLIDGINESFLAFMAAIGVVSSIAVVAICIIWLIEHIRFN